MYSIFRFLGSRHPQHVLKQHGISFRFCMGMETNMTELLTVAEFKERYKISHSAFYREVAAHRIPIRKIGRATRIAITDAEAWAASLPTHGGEVSNG